MRVGAGACGVFHRGGLMVQSLGVSVGQGEVGVNLREGGIGG